MAWQQRNVAQALRAPQQQMQVNTPQRIKIESTPQQNYQAPAGNDGMSSLMNNLGTKGAEMFAGGSGGGGWLGAGAADAGTGSIFQTGGGFGNSGMAYPELFGGGSAGGGSAAGAGTTGLGTAAGYGAALLGAGIGADNLMNNSDDKWYSAEKVNDYGTIGMGGKDIGFRFGDLGNGINPVTWAKDPKKGANGLLNFFTGGIFD